MDDTTVALSGAGVMTSQSDRATLQRIKAFLKKFAKDFAKFMVFDIISGVLITVLVAHFGFGIPFAI